MNDRTFYKIRFPNNMQVTFSKIELNEEGQIICGAQQVYAVLYFGLLDYAERQQFLERLFNDLDEAFAYIKENKDEVRLWK